MDLSQSISVNDIQRAWWPIDGDIGPNYFFALAALPEMNHFVIDGARGQGDGKPIAQEVSVLYDVEKNQWNNQVGSTERRIRE